MKNKSMNFRVTEKDYNYIIKQARKSNLTITDFIVRSALNKNIYVIDGLPEVVKELAYIGNNLNQLTRLCHQGKITCLQLDDICKRIDNIWRLLSSLTPSLV